jgi:hypothetical protein
MQRAIIPILFAKPRRQHLERLCEVEDMIQVRRLSQSIYNILGTEYQMYGES